MTKRQPTRAKLLATIKDLRARLATSQRIRVELTKLREMERARAGALTTRLCELEPALEQAKKIAHDTAAANRDLEAKLSKAEAQRRYWRGRVTVLEARARK